MKPSHTPFTSSVITVRSTHGALAQPRPRRSGVARRPTRVTARRSRIHPDTCPIISSPRISRQAHWQAQRGGAGEASTRRRLRLKGRVALIWPFISSLLTVASPRNIPRASLKVNTSPATEPSKAPDDAPIKDADRPPVRKLPATRAPSCLRSNRRSSMAPAHAPVTFSVTRVRSIQSFCAQPAVTASAMTRRAHAAVIFTTSPSPRGRRLDSTHFCSIATDDAVHLVAACGELSRKSPARIDELEHITGHRPLEGSFAGDPAGHAPGGAELSRHLATLLLQCEPDVFAASGRADHGAIPGAAHVFGDQGPVDPVLLRAADGARDRQHQEHSREGPRLLAPIPGPHRGGDPVRESESTRWSDI